MGDLLLTFDLHGIRDILRYADAVFVYDLIHADMKRAFRCHFNGKSVDLVPVFKIQRQMDRDLFFIRIDHADRFMGRIQAVSVRRKKPSGIYFTNIFASLILYDLNYLLLSLYEKRSPQETLVS